MKVSVQTKSGSSYLFNRENMRYVRFNPKGYANSPENTVDEGLLRYWPEFNIGYSLNFNNTTTTPVILIKLES